MGEPWGKQFLRVCLVAALMFGIGFYPLMHQIVAPPAVESRCLFGQVAGSRCLHQSRRLFRQAVTAIAVSPDGTLLASAYRDQIHLWDLAQARRIKILRGHRHWVSSLAFHPKWGLAPDLYGKRNTPILASSSLDQTIRLWDLETSETIATLPSGRMTQLSFSPDGRSLLGASQFLDWADGTVGVGGVHIWDLTTQRLQQIQGVGAIKAFALSSDGQWLAIAGDSLQLWRKLEQPLIDQSENPAAITDLTFAPDNRLLIGGPTLRWWQVPTGQPVQVIRSQVASLALSPDGQTLLTANGGTLYFWQLSSRRFLGGIRASEYGRVQGVFALGGQAVISAGSDGIRLWWEVAMP